VADLTIEIVDPTVGVGELDHRGMMPITMNDIVTMSAWLWRA
jgi:hypothetical protein